MVIISIYPLIEGIIMKLLLLFFTIVVSGCVSLNNDLQNAIAFGDIHELNSYSPNIDKSLLVRLYSSPEFKENCFVETHGVCKYNYFLSVSTFDEHPETNIYRLKTEGEFVSVNWKKSEDIDTAELDLVLNQYSTMAIKNNTSLNNQKQRVRLKANVFEIFESIELIEDK